MSCVAHEVAGSARHHSIRIDSKTNISIMYCTSESKPQKRNHLARDDYSSGKELAGLWHL